MKTPTPHLDTFVATLKRKAHAKRKPDSTAAIAPALMLKLWKRGVWGMREQRK